MVNVSSIRILPLGIPWKRVIFRYCCDALECTASFNNMYGFAHGENHEKVITLYETLMYNYGMGLAFALAAREADSSQSAIRAKYLKDFADKVKRQLLPEVTSIE